MGEVFFAERADGQFSQTAALKLIRRGREHDPLLIRRFLEERRILATLTHPGVARLLDGGVTDAGLPWFAMEYRRGTATRSLLRRPQARRARPSRADGASARRGRVRAPESARAPRPQAREHLRHRRWRREVAGLRHREAARRRGRLGSGNDARVRARDDAGVRLARTGARRARDCGHGHLLARRGALPIAHGPARAPIREADRRGDRAGRVHHRSGGAEPHDAGCAVAPCCSRAIWTRSCSRRCRRIPRGDTPPPRRCSRICAGTGKAGRCSRVRTLSGIARGNSWAVTEWASRPRRWSRSR